MRPVDLSKSKAGDTIEFEKVVIKSIILDDSNIYNVSFKNIPYPLPFHENGNAVRDGFKISSITPATFDWKDVKQGMGFTNISGSKTLWFVAHDYNDKRYVIMSCDSDCYDFESCTKESLTRAPEHDHPCVKGGE